MQKQTSNFLLKAIQAILTFFLFSVIANAQQRVQGYVQQGGFQYSASASAKVQRSYPNATITVYLAGTTTLASIYSDSLLTPKSNPFNADANAYYNFYVNDGSYDIKFSGTGIAIPFTLADIQVGFFANSISAGVYNNPTFTVNSKNRISAIKANSTDIKLINSTNLIPNPVFVNLSNTWSRLNGVGNVIDTRPILISGDVIGGQYSNIGLLLQQTSGIGENAVITAMPFSVDNTKKYRFGISTVSFLGTETMNMRLQFIKNFQVWDSIGGIVQALTPPIYTNTGLNVQNISLWINPVSGSAPKLSSTTVAVHPQLESIATVGGYIRVFGAYFIEEGKLPTTDFVAVNNGNGTHEGIYCNGKLYVVSHTFNTLSKYNPVTLEREAIIPTNSYPHDLMCFNNSIYVENYLAATTQKFDSSTLALQATYPSLGSRKGFGIGNDGTNIFIACGESGNDAILKLTTSSLVDGTSTGETVLSTDILTNGANSPALLNPNIAGSVWGVSYTLGQVKRINTSTGATIATISPSLGPIYGLGNCNNSNYIYANAHQGVARIDPATNTVTEIKRFQKGSQGSSNIKCDERTNTLWGGAAGSDVLWAWDLTNDIFIEKIITGGGVKWVQPTDYGVIVGFYHWPHIEVYTLN